MKKFYTLFIIAFVTLFGLTSCGDEAVDVETVNKQTVFIYMPWTGNASGSDSGLLSYFKTNLNDIESAIKTNKGLNNSRVVVFLSTSPTESSFYEMVYNKSTQEIEHSNFSGYTDDGSVSAERISNLLNEVTSKAEALNYAMIIGCHGSGWTYKEDWEDYPTRTTSASSNKQWLFNYMASDNPNKQTRFFGSVSTTGSNYQMNIEELAEGLQNSNIILQGQKLQYILFDDCYMANAEVAYALRNATNHIIASGSEVMAYGMPYDKLWSYLNSPTPNYSSVVSSFYDFYSNYTNAPYGNLAAIDCRQIEGLAALMKEINQNYTMPEGSMAKVQVLDGFRPNLFYDLSSYVENMGVEGMLREQFEAQLQKTVIAAKSTEEVYTAIFRGSTIKIDQFSGLSISDPSTHPVAEKGLRNTAWWQATH